LQQTLYKILLSPFTLLYGIGISIRNFLYARGYLRGVKFDLPVISVGNLTVGGEGKTPHVEYLIRLLDDYINMATLSRGYKRKTRGFRIANDSDTVETIGDEPLQYYRKFPDVKVTVAENRMFAIPNLLTEHPIPEVQAVLLDDAFQHRAIKPGLNILLTQFRFPFTRDWLLPSGRLREWRSAYQRADMIIISKCPDTITKAEREEYRKEIAPLPHQSLYFSKYEYDMPFDFHTKESRELKSNHNIIIVCALANTDYLSDYLNQKAKEVKRIEFPDHHYFTNSNISRIRQIYDNWDVPNKVIITTEKDATRLERHQQFMLENNMDVLVLPTRVTFMGDDGDAFDDEIKQFLLQFEA